MIYVMDEGFLSSEAPTVSVKKCLKFVYGLHNATVLSRWDGKAVSVVSKYNKLNPHKMRD